MKIKRITFLILILLLTTLITPFTVSASSTFSRTSDYFSDTNDYECCSNDLYVYVESLEEIADDYKIKGTINELINSKISLIKRNISRDNIKGYKTNVSYSNYKDKQVISNFDITIQDDNSTSYNPTGNYIVKVLLPEDVRSYKYIDVSSINDLDDKVTIYKTKRIANWIQFETDDFTNFYLLGDAFNDEDLREVNLWPFIILTFILIVITLILIAWVKSLVKRLKMLSVVAPIMLVVTPFGGFYILLLMILLFVLALLYLIYLFMKFKRIGSNKNEEVITIYDRAIKPRGKMIDRKYEIFKKY